MPELVAFDPSVHLQEYYQMQIANMDWHQNEFINSYQFDFLASFDFETSKELVDVMIKDYINLKPPDGIIYLLLAEKKVAATGTIRKIDNNVGQIRLMYTFPQYRRRGYSRQILNKLLEAGKELGYSPIWIATPKCSVAHHLYRSVGFNERDFPKSYHFPYPKLKPYINFMEKIQ